MNQTPPPMNAASLAEAFQAFARASDELTQAYNGLQGQVSALTERLTLLMAALPAGVVLLDAAGNTEQLNHAALGMLGEIPVGTPWAQLLTRFEPADTPGEYFLGHPHEDALRIVLAETPRDAQGGRIVLLHDVTEAWRMRQQTARTERLAAMGEMVAGLAHQLRTPLAAALLYTGHMASTELDPGTRGKVAERALERLRHLEKLIQDMLIFARGEALGRESFGVCELVAELAHTIDPVAHGRGIHFKADCQAGNRKLFGNRKEIASALLNLLENALQILGEHGEVALCARLDEGNAIFSVRDDGRGIPQELQERLFEPFYTTRADGTGLGLAIARGVARAHGGEISLKSAPGEGSEFFFRIPLAPADVIESSGDTA
ncbi:MAG: PAS domain-containing sensor histidine kinase [Candidatus Dactylopiibacterium carminicum]|uniref:histidine kinase n=1 Tax=Candidatus Dactylopiibacterium carminicum TaxID=857335 RepID=A0A272ER55_9RHOO|nr:ATP-binding protein [Candidatus Dactylopiibacterium carminicum]KAF7598672.1 PAS domain-containing sensor histidine kinase [Candidatus Dactylopiibacterium carminicum]PAS92562.1 MAG: PAS domain-containing sensor histidine kinase [Candidatus Dactylopiibacterium carminicum]PAS96079.1 MAG: PAS domain-containing sensor histidine kinase [Candidatus Dactylopiibacterium carminicum]PAS98540.1 MAG: PAS domain-containing sensor histidine kinase [Candidatus Dactylopiibacterium carminicum]